MILVVVDKGSGHGYSTKQRDINIKSPTTQHVDDADAVGGVVVGVADESKDGKRRDYDYCYVLGEEW